MSNSKEIKKIELLRGNLIKALGDGRADKLKSVKRKIKNLKDVNIELKKSVAEAENKDIILGIFLNNLSQEAMNVLSLAYPLSQLQRKEVDDAVAPPVVTISNNPVSENQKEAQATNVSVPRSVQFISGEKSRLVPELKVSPNSIEMSENVGKPRVTTVDVVKPPVEALNEIEQLRVRLKTAMKNRGLIKNYVLQELTKKLKEEVSYTKNQKKQPSNIKDLQQKISSASSARKYDYFFKCLGLTGNASLTPMQARVFKKTLAALEAPSVVATATVERKQKVVDNVDSKELVSLKEKNAELNDSVNMQKGNLQSMITRIEGCEEEYEKMIKEINTLKEELRKLGVKEPELEKIERWATGLTSETEVNSIPESILKNIPIYKEPVNAKEKKIISEKELVKTNKALELSLKKIEEQISLISGKEKESVVVKNFEDKFNLLSGLRVTLEERKKMAVNTVSNQADSSYSWKPLGKLGKEEAAKARQAVSREEAARGKSQKLVIPGVHRALNPPPVVMHIEKGPQSFLLFPAKAIAAPAPAPVEKLSEKEKVPQEAPVVSRLGYDGAIPPPGAAPQQPEVSVIDIERKKLKKIIQTLQEENEKYIIDTQEDAKKMNNQGSVLFGRRISANTKGKFEIAMSRDVALRKLQQKLEKAETLGEVSDVKESFSKLVKDAITNDKEAHGVFSSAGRVREMLTDAQKALDKSGPRANNNLGE